MKASVDFTSLARRARSGSGPVFRGRVLAVGESSIEAELLGGKVGLIVNVEPVGPSAERPRLAAEIASCNGCRVTLLPLGDTTGIGPGDRVTTRQSRMNETIPCGPALLGRIIDPLGQPIDARGQLARPEQWDLNREPPNPLTRKLIDTQLVTGISLLDGCLCLGVGQRIGLFAGPGLGKSTLLADLAKRADVDVSVICLVGERGREVREFIDERLGPEGLSKSVVVLATADAPPLIRLRALKTATAIGEWFRAKGKRALLLVDSLTRVVRACQEIALASVNSPTQNGYPVSATTVLPSLLERTGQGEIGSITAVYAVLTEGDTSTSDPAALEARSLLDGHVVLSPHLAEKGQWPAIDLLRSLSRVMESIVTREQLQWSRKFRRLLAAYENHEDLIKMGAYQRGSSPDTDLAIERRKEITDFLTQGPEPCSIDATLSKLANIVRNM